MVELPMALRRHKPATTSIHEPPPSPWSPKLGQILSYILILLGLFVTGWGAYTLYQKASQQQIKQVYIDGVGEQQQQIARYLAPVLHGNYFTLDLSAIRDRTLTIPWVEQVVVYRLWPDSVLVRITPRVPVAHWGTRRYLSDDGTVFLPAHLPKRPLPLLQGPSSQTMVIMGHYRDISTLFAPLNLRVKEVYLTDRMTWFIQFDNGLRVIVDHNQTMSKLQRLAALARSDLRPVWNNVAAVDLRYRNGLSLQWKHGQMPTILSGQFAQSAVTPKTTVEP